MSKKADMVVYGNIYTENKIKPKTEAVAILDGKFVYVGEKVGVKDYICEHTQMVHYDQSIIRPGLGSIAVGQQANLVVLGEEITASTQDQMTESSILRKMAGGKWVYINEK